MLKLTLYTRIGCHLCDDMYQQLNDLRQDYSFFIRTIDVDSDVDLCQRYGDKVPVLMAGETQLCHYFLNPVIVIQYLKNSV